MVSVREKAADANCRLRRTDGFAVYRWPDGSSSLRMRAGRAQTHTLLAGNMAANTTAPAADTVWINVGAVRSVASELDFQLLEFGQRMSLRDVAKRVPATAARVAN